MDNIYVVFGSTGEYSDRSEWTIVAYYDEELAKQHVVLATEAANIMEAISEQNGGRYWQVSFSSNVYDPQGRMDYTGTRYWYETVPTALILPGGA